MMSLKKLCHSLKRNLKVCSARREYTMEYGEVAKHVGKQVYLESFCSDRWFIYRAYGTIESISPYVAVFIPSQVITCMHHIYKNLSPIHIPTLTIDMICATLTTEDMYNDLLLE